MAVARVFQFAMTLMLVRLLDVEDSGYYQIFSLMRIGLLT